MMTKIKKYEVTCINCGNKFSALYMFSANSFMQKSLSKEEEEKKTEFWKNNGICPKCQTKNEVGPDLPELPLEEK